MTVDHNANKRACKALHLSMMLDVRLVLNLMDGHHVTLVSASHGQQVLAVLQAFRERRALFDFSIRVQGETLPCHRCVLAACSDFFRYQC